MAWPAREHRRRQLAAATKLSVVALVVLSFSYLPSFPANAVTLVHSNTDISSPLIDELAPAHHILTWLPRQLGFIHSLLSALDWSVPAADSDRQLYHVDQGDFRPYRKWHQWLQESCFILGFSDLNGQAKGGHVQCPELYVDESWPTGTSVTMPAAQLTSVGGQRVVVLQAKVVRQLPAEEVKAQLGRELTRLAWSPVIPLPYIYGAGRAAQWMLGDLPVQETLASLTPAVETLSDTLSDKLSDLSRAISPSRTPKLPSSAQAALNRRVPLLLSPVMKGATFEQRVEVEPQRPQPTTTRPASRSAAKTAFKSPSIGGPLRDIAAVALLSAVSAERTRAGVVVADRVAALACGDAEAAAVSILRTNGQMPRGSYDTHRQGALLRKVVAEAAENKWSWRVKKAITASSEVHAEARVKLLLDWTKSAEGKRLMAVAVARRNHFRQKRLSFKRFWRRPSGPSVSLRWRKQVQGGSKVWGRQRGIQFILALILLVPFTRTVDPVRWAAMCSLVTTGLALLSPLQLRVWPSHVMVPLLGGVFVYVYLLHGVWWNHLLGGSNRWARLSAKFAADVADQANVTASIAYLTRHWAEMAKRSMEHLDEELCGSWRSSLHELAAKLNDLQQELNQGSPTKGQPGAMQLGHTNVPMPPSFDNSADEAGGPANLWLKVDRVVQEAAHVECARVRHAGQLDESESLRSMMTWWMADDDSQDDKMILGSDESIIAPTETLGQLLLTEQLHQRYGYQSFHNKDAGGAVDLVEREAWPEANQFQKLEREVSLTFHSLEELRSQVSLWQDTRTALFWTYADFRRVWLEYQRAIWGPRKDTRHHMHYGDQQKSLTSMSCLLLAAFAGFGLAVASALSSHWGWCLGCFNFGAANGVLLLNFAKLRLPHVHRRFSQRLGQLRASREKILAEMQVAQRAAQSGGVTHLRACITYQSVNMLRNINYVASCVKAQVQRAAAEDRPWEQRRHVAMCGLQMLLTLLPRRQLLDKADALAPDDCNLALAVLHDKRRGMTLVALRNNVLLWREFASMRKKVIDAQRNLWLLFRLVHFSSAIPAEEQGQLKALLDRFIRPVLVEGRVPLGHRPEALEGVAGHRGSRAWRAKEVAPPPDAPERRTMEVSRRSHSFCSESSWQTLSGKSTVDSEQNILDAKKMLHRLAATRADIANVLARLPPAALVDASLATCPPTGAIFTDVFSSIIVGIHPGYIPDDSTGKPQLQLQRSNSSLPQASEPVAFAVGYSHGDQEYHLDGHIRTTLLLRVLYPKLNASCRAGVGAEAEYDVQQFSVPLSAITTDEPPREALEAAWIAVEGRLCLADGRLGESALKARRRSLRRAKDVLRSLHGRRAP